MIRPQAGLVFNEARAVVSLTAGFGSSYISKRSIFTMRADHTSSVEQLASTAWAMKVKSW